MMGSHGRLGKGVWYEESMGIPFIVRWPGVIRPRRDDLLLGAPDIMPTLLGLMGLSAWIPEHVQGLDLSRTLRDGVGPRPGSVPYIEPGVRKVRARGLRTHRYTYVRRHRVRGGVDVMLFDNREDPFQIRDVAPDNRSVVEEMHEELLAWLTRIGDPWAQGAS